MFEQILRDMRIIINVIVHLPDNMYRNLVCLILYHTYQNVGSACIVLVGK